MGAIFTSDLKIGMVLASDILDHQGSIILKSKTSITKKDLKILKMWGITEVDVEDLERKEILAESRSQMNPAILEKVEVEANRLFQKANTDHPAMKELRDQYIVRSVKAITEKEESNAPA
jgi:hypothetical protein